MLAVLATLLTKVAEELKIAGIAKEHGCLSRAENKWTKLNRMFPKSVSISPPVPSAGAQL